MVAVSLMEEYSIGSKELDLVHVSVKAWEDSKC